jgi:hypothetical protein
MVFDPAVAARIQTAGRRTVSNENFGANDGGRTRDIQDHNLALCQLSYIRREPLIYPRWAGS